MDSWNAVAGEYEHMEARIVALHATGMAPSEIDERMGLVTGTAHDVMVARWKFDKEARLRHV